MHWLYIVPVLCLDSLRPGLERKVVTATPAVATESAHGRPMMRDTEPGVDVPDSLARSRSARPVPARASLTEAEPEAHGRSARSILYDMVAPLRLPTLPAHAAFPRHAEHLGTPSKLADAATSALGAASASPESMGGVMLVSGLGKMPKTVAARLSVQDVAVLAAVMLFYMCTIAIALSLVYHTSVVKGGVKWFSEPEMHTLSTSSYADFCSVFNRPPETHVRVIVMNKENTRRRLDVMLDATSLFTVQDSSFGDESTSNAQLFMRHTGLLASLVIYKRVTWDGFEELEPKIAQKMRSLGMEGSVSVSYGKLQRAVVRKNTHLFHFVNNQITLILVLMSLVGPLIFFPAVWFMKKTSYAHSEFRLRTDMDDYAALVEEAVLHAMEQAEASSPEASNRGDDTD